MGEWGYIEEAEALRDDIVADRRWLHRHPETGFDLPETAAYVASRLREIGCEPCEIIPGGIVAHVGNVEGPCFMLRADMDALPLREEADVPFASANGNMHACGHDAHTAMLLGVARILKNHEAELKGCVKLMFQPDEEGTAPDEVTGSGAMLAAGVLENPPVEAAAGIHLMTVDYARGRVYTRFGAAFSSVDDVDIEIVGKGCHGSQPQHGIDPINIAAHVFLALENLIAREVDPTEQCVLTFGSIHGGSAANIIPDSVHMLGTLRTVSEKTRDRMKKRIAAIAERIAEGFGGTAKVRFLRGVPSVYNDPALTEELVGYIEGEAIAEVELLEKPLPGSDDMSVISQAVPTSYFVLGAGSAEEGCAYPVHSPHVVFDESVFPQGSALAAAIAMRWLENRGGGEQPRGRARLAD